MRASLSRPDRRALWVVALAALVYLGCFELLHHGFYRDGVITDVPVYQSYGTAMRVGQAPYRDFAVEYPPGALPMFVLPTYLSANYGDAFWWLMGAFGVCCIVLVAAARPPRYALPFLALSPLAVGSYLPTRFDLWPTALMLAGVAALLADRHRLGWAALAASFCAKLFPVALLPLAALWTLRRRGAAELARGLAIALLVVAAAFGPFLVIAPHGLWQSLWGELSRPLQIESLGAAFLMTFARPAVIVTHGSFNLGGEGALGSVSAVVSWVAIAACWIAFARGAAERERFLRLTAASVCAFVAFGKVLSPQYLIWLIPLVPLVRGRRGLAATALLLAALLDTQVWFPHAYFPYVNHRHLAWLVLLRDLMLVALFFVLSLPARGSRRSSRPVRRERTRRAPLRSERPPRRLRVGPETP